MTDEEFESLFEKAKDMQPFRPFYSDIDACYKDYAHRIAKSFNGSHPACESCGRSRNLAHFQADWKANYQNADTTRFNFITLISVFFSAFIVTHRVMKFSTLHTLCLDCKSRDSVRDFGSNLVSVLVQLIAALSIVAAPFFVYYVIYNLCKGLKVETGAWVTLILLLVSSVFFRWLIPKAESRRAPDYVRSIAKFPFHLRRLQRIQLE